jgi:toxin ParE1/3/4
VSERRVLELDISPQAEEDLDAIFIYTAKAWSNAKAVKYVNQIIAVFDLLCEMPNIARERREFWRPVRIHNHKSHVIVYTADASTLTVVRVLHAKQNWMGELDLIDEE